ncbi:temperature dependent protein affecting M2 dsRNA replication-domain-containing protein [Lipomyces doorenjongii]
MTIKALENFIHDRKQARGLPLTILKDTVLGIDAEYFFLQQLSPPGKKEPLLHALGGLPFSLKSCLEAFLHGLKGAGIKPVFVFKGIQLYRNERPFARPDLRQQKRAEAWEAYDKAKGETAVNIFNEIEPIPVSEVSRYAMKLLNENGADYVVAPYSSWAQLVYLLKHEKKFIDAIYGPTEVLLYDVERVITSIDFAGGGFLWISKRNLLAELGGLGSEQLLDLAVLCGLEFSSPFPLIDQPHLTGTMAVRSARDLIRNFVSGYGAVMAYAENPFVKESNYIDTYRRAYCAIKYHIVYTDKGFLEPIITEHAPNDIHEFITQRLPPELYFYLTKGIMGPEILNALTSGELIESVPLDGGESLEYRRFLSDLESMRSQSLSLLTQPLHRFYQAKRVYVVYWYERNNEHEIPHRLTPTTYETVNSWNVHSRVLDPKLMELNQKEVNLEFAVVSLDDEKFAASTVTPKTPGELLETSKEILANTYWRFLQLRSFVTPQHTLTPWGKALVTALKASRTEDLFAEPLIAALELIRFKALTAKSYTPSYTGLPIRGTDVEKAHILLIARVASLLPINHMPIGFSGPLSRNLLSFNSFVAKYTQIARTLIESTICSLLANSDADRLAEDNAGWAKLGVSLPFTSGPNSGLGIAMKTYLDELCGKPEPTSDVERVKMKTELKKLFAHALDVVGDVERGFRLWDTVVQAVKLAAKEGTMTNTEATAFIDADAWVQQRR